VSSWLCIHGSIERALELICDRPAEQLRVMRTWSGSGVEQLTTPFWLFIQLILIFDINFNVGGSSGYRLPHSIFNEYILFSYGVWEEETIEELEIEDGNNRSRLTRGGPMIIPVQWVNVMSSSFSRPQEIVPSPTPFWPASSSSSKRKFRGTTDQGDTQMNEWKEKKGKQFN
jgi:hypothetical protein